MYVKLVILLLGRRPTRVRRGLLLVPAIGPFDDTGVTSTAFGPLTVRTTPKRTLFPADNSVSPSTALW